MFPCRLSNQVQPYAWGSHSAIADLLGTPSPSPGPQAELWMGTHPAGPSRVEGTRTTLTELIANAPDECLGQAVIDTFGARLPFLFKVLAVAEPLSLQVHPDASQAKQGFLRDQELPEPSRNYRDPSHKPELLVALTRFDTLIGFRPVHETMRLLDSLHAPVLVALLNTLTASPNASTLRDVVTSLLHTPVEERRQVVASVLEACQQHAEWSLSWALRLGERYPDDMGVVTSLFMNHVVLAPGDAVFVPPRCLHAYLDGVGVEVMASSDNVLRGGLTTKRVNLPALLEVLEVVAKPVEVLRGETLGAQTVVYKTPASEFRLFRIELDGNEVVDRSPLPRVVLSTAGNVELYTGGECVRLEQGASAFARAIDCPLRIRGKGTVFVATVGLDRGPDQ